MKLLEIKSRLKYSQQRESDRMRLLKNAGTASYLLHIISLAAKQSTVFIKYCCFGNKAYVHFLFI